MEKLATIPPVELGAVSGGVDRTFNFPGVSQSDCFAKIGRGVAHGFDLTGPWKPQSAMRPDEHLLLDKANNEAGAAMWSNGVCTVGVSTP